MTSEAVMDPGWEGGQRVYASPREKVVDLWFGLGRK